MLVRILSFAVVWFGVNLLIAGFLTAIGGPHFSSFGSNLTYGLCISAFTSLLFRAAIRFVPRGGWRLPVVLVCVLVGAALGGITAQRLTGYQGPELVHSNVWVTGGFFGGISVLLWWMSMGIQNLRQEVQERELARSEAEKRSLEAQLKMLQAQIEPHFLFNSLANVSALIAIDPPQAGKLLDALIQYLRASLTRTRADGGTLGDEVDLLTAYLSVLKIRMGQRLAFTIEVPDALRDLPFPPMLAQPLVENAIAHGLEPRIEGGSVTVSALPVAGGLRIVVRDSGLGIRGAPHEGTGLSNIRARLQALYGVAGRLTFEATAGGGTTAILEIPA